MNSQVAEIQLFSRKKKLHKLVFADRKLRSYWIAEELKIPERSLFTILH